MTIRRQWLLVLVLSVLISVSVNTVVLSSLINNYFIDYSTDNYNKNISRLLNFSKEALSVNVYSSQQLEMQLETFLSDPINRIRLYDANGNLIANVTSKEHQGMGRMRNGMMNGMMNHMMGNASEEVYSADIEDNGVIIGKVNITKYSSIGNSLETRKFTYSLIASS
ncbi:MAG TPA: sensor histidine kinase, partial [Clostridiales bacterium]|nr:sensor histidine kinase [Clostridiales bacterium]